MPSEGIRRETASHGAVRRGAERGGGGDGGVHDVLARTRFHPSVVHDLSRDFFVRINIGNCLIDHDQHAVAVGNG